MLLHYYPEHGLMSIVEELSPTHHLVVKRSPLILFPNSWKILASQVIHQMV